MIIAHVIARASARNNSHTIASPSARNDAVVVIANEVKQSRSLSYVEEIASHALAMTTQLRSHHVFWKQRIETIA
jgi:hypothetical protein